MRTKVYIPQGKPPGSYGHMYLDDCLGGACPTGYLAAGYVEMNQDLKAAHERIATLLEQARKLAQKADEEGFRVAYEWNPRIQTLVPIGTPPKAV